MMLPLDLQTNNVVIYFASVGYTLPTLTNLQQSEKKL